MGFNSGFKGLNLPALQKKTKATLYLSWRGFIVFIYYNNVFRASDFTASNDSNRNAKQSVYKPLTEPQVSRSMGFQDFQKTDTRRWSVCKPHAPAAFTPQDSHLCQGVSRSQGHSLTGKITSVKIYSKTIKNRTRDLPTYRAVPQPTAARRAA